MKTSEKIGRLFDYAASKRDGFTYQDVAIDLEWDRGEFFAVARKLRIMLGNDDTINLVCEPQGQSQPWRYQLVGTVDDARGWVTNRMTDCETRVVTILAICATLVSATDGRTAQGRRARIMNKGLARIVEDLAELDHGTPLF